MADTDTKVIVIGAGSAGLLLAQGLKSAGIPFRLFERHSHDHQSREWGMSMHWGGEFLATVLPPELRKRLSEIDTDPHYDSTKDGGYVQCNGETGEVLVVMPGVMPRRVSRKRLRNLLSEGLDIQYNKKLDLFRIDESSGVVTVDFADGTTVTGKALVGCDGSRSRVRALLVDDEKLSEPFDAGCTILNFPYSYSAEVSQRLRDIHPVIKIGYHPKIPAMYLLSILDGASPKPEDWKYQHVISWTGPPYPADLVSPESRIAQLKAIGAPFAHPWRTAAEEVSDDAMLFVDRGTSWDPRTVFKSDKSGGSTWNGNQWHGLVTLAGDAAHTMLPHRGQGLNNALEDGSRLVTALTEVFKADGDGDADKDKNEKIKTAIARYETEMVARGGAEVELTLRQSKAAHNWDMLMQSPMFKHGANKVK